MTVHDDAMASCSDLGWCEEFVLLQSGLEMPICSVQRELRSSCGNGTFAGKCMRYAAVIRVAAVSWLLFVLVLFADVGGSGQAVMGLVRCR